MLPPAPLISHPVMVLIEQERLRQRETLMLIPSENYASKAVNLAVGSVFGNKYAEGYPGRRYYEGNIFADKLEQMAIDQAKELFGVPHVNVQPYSGSPANGAILLALCNPGDTIMGMTLSAGGHLTHGHPTVTFSGKYCKSVQYGLGKDARIDYEQMEKLALEHKPKVIFIGTTAYPFILDFKRAREIADKVDAYLVADISHIAGLVIGKAHPSPVPFVHIIMTTTHKTLRGPRGAMLMVTESGIAKDATLPKKIDAAVFPGMQGGPHLNTIAGIAVALDEATKPSFQQYGKQVVANAQVLATALKERGIKLVGDGTENHLMIMDFSADGFGKGTLVARAMNAARLVANRNTVPGDPNPFYPSGVRLGTPAITTRGMKPEHMKEIARWIAGVVTEVQGIQFPEEKSERAAFLEQFTVDIKKNLTIRTIAREVRALTDQFIIAP